MGFFDFLLGQQAPAAAAVGPKPRRPEDMEFVGPTLEEGGLPPEAGAPNYPSLLKGVERRAGRAEQAATEAVSGVFDVLHDIPDPKDKADYETVRSAARKGVINPTQIAGDLDDLASRKSIPDDTRYRFAKAANAIREASGLQQTASDIGKEGARAGAFKDPYPPEQVKSEVHALEKKLEALRAQRPMAGVLSGPKLSEDIAREERALQWRKERLAEAEQPQVAEPPAAPVSGDPLTKLAGAGLSREDFGVKYSQFADVLKQGGWDLKARVQGAFAETFVNLASIFGAPGMAMLARITGPATRASVTVASAQGKEGEQPPSPAEMKLRQREEAAETTYREMSRLSDEDADMTVGKVLMLVIFSLLIGPKMTFHFFTNRAKIGRLKSDLDYLDSEVTRYQRHVQHEQTVAQRARQAAAGSEQKERFHADRMDMDRAKMFYQTQRYKDPQLDLFYKGVQNWHQRYDDLKEMYTDRLTGELRPEGAKVVNEAWNMLETARARYRDRLLQLEPTPAGVAK